MIEIRAYTSDDIETMKDIWNEVVEEGIAFPQEEMLDYESAQEFFASQTHCGVAVDNIEIVGMYIVHPNNIGRCGHIANASYAVAGARRSKGIGRLLVQDSLAQAKAHGFRIMQFNAVVASNARARHLYESLGFIQLGTIPGGFHMADGTYVDICPYYLEL